METIDILIGVIAGITAGIFAPKLVRIWNKCYKKWFGKYLFTQDEPWFGKSKGEDKT